MPLEWVDYRDAVRLHYLGQVAYSCVHHLPRLRGINAATSLQSSVESVHHRHHRPLAGRGGTRDCYVPPLNNKTLFRRDSNLCCIAACASRSAS